MTMAASATSLWGYALAELAPITRQRRCLPDVARKTNVANSSGEKPGGAPHCATLDGATTRRLLDECSSRGVSLESALLASLFLASAAAVSTAEQTEGTGTQVDRHPLGGEGGRGSVSVGAGGYSKPVGIRMQRASVLGIVSVVMALLSGSVDSKALRYFCSFYAVFAGVWAVNAITVEVPGFIIIMATRAVTKTEGERERGNGDRRATAFTPVRLAVDCRSGLWDTAERYRRQSVRITALSEEAFARFKRRARGLRIAWSRFLRGWGQRRERQSGSSTSASDAASASTDRTTCGEPKTPFQLFGCIELDDRIARASAPETAPSKDAVDGNGTARSATSAAAFPDDESGKRTLKELLTLVDARYTLLHHVTECHSVESSPADGGGVWRREGGYSVAKGREGGGGGSGAGGAGSGTRPNDTATVPSDWSQESGGDSSHEGSTGGLELTLIDSNGCGRMAEDTCFGKEDGNNVTGDRVAMLAWLLKRAAAILVDAVTLPATAD